MKKDIQFIILLLLSGIFLSANIMAEESGIPAPANTILTNQKINSGEKIINSTYYYSSTLSRDTIIEFYKEMFIRQGMYELPNFGDTFLFQKIPLRTASLNFTASVNKEKTEFFINTIEMKKLPVLPANDFKSPQTLDFMPIYPNSTQFLYYAPSTSSFIGIGYLTSSSPEEAKSLYLEQMPGFGWKLTNEDPHSGTYNFSEWLRFVDPYTQMLSYHNFAANFSEIVPPLKLRGSTLQFTQGNKKCTVAIYKFEDMLEKAKVTKTVWDVSAFEQYGETIIEVYYFYK